MCNVFDAKHTNQDDGGSTSITVADQTGLYKAVCMVDQQETVNCYSKYG
jgi:hypothetical protein